MHFPGQIRPAILLAWLAGGFEALLLARLAARLLAARPDNPTIALLYRATEPLLAPLAFLDRGQPPFGASLELSTIALAMIVPILAYAAWAWLGRDATPGQGPTS